MPPQDQSNLNNNSNLEKKYKIIIAILSFVIPLVVAVLFGINLKDLGYDVTPLTFLPPIYATINGLTAISLVLAVTAIKKGNKILHRKLMRLAMFFSILFLLMYVAYHMTSTSTPFGGQGVIRYVYFFILITHILLSIAVIPMVLFTYMRAILGQYEKHRKLAKFTFPIWLYVAVSGVVVYLMISPYYTT